MAEFIYFLGRFHVLLLHVPIGILLLAVAMEGASRTRRFRYLAPAMNAVWLLGAMSAIATAVLGHLHASEGGFDDAAVNAHRVAGTSLAALAIAVWLVRTKLAAVYAKTWPALALAVIVLLLVTGHFGGNLTHGDTYLVQYAPAPLRHLMGVSDERVPRPRPKDLASADIYLDVVAPALAQRCSGCHNDGKRKGQLSVASYGKLMKGGEHGAVIVAGDPEHSDLIRRISLPPEDQDFMPHDGKTPLTAEQTAAIRWWVETGAPRTARVASLQPPTDVRTDLEAALGLRSPAAPMQASTAGSPPDVLPPLPKVDVPRPDVNLLDALEARGFVVRAIAAESPLVQVDYTASRHISDADLAELNRISRQIYTLNLRDAGITDAQLETLGRFQNLTRLRLELNPITDAGLAHLAGLNHLESLNLYGTNVDDAGLASLVSLARLHHLFLWQTAVTPAAVAEIRRTRAGLLVDSGFDPKTFPEGPRIIPVVN